MRALLYLLVVMVCAYGCSHERNYLKEPDTAERAITPALTKINDDIPPVTENDTLVIDQRSVVFFTPSAQELHHISTDQGTSEGISMAVGDFAYYASQVADSLERHGIPVVFTHKKYISIPSENAPVLIDRSEKGDFMGLVVFDGENTPRIIYGLHTHLSLWAAITDYFAVEEPPAMPLWDYFKPAAGENLHVYSSHSDILNQRGQRINADHYDKFGPALAGRANKYRMSFFGYYKFSLTDSLIATVCRVPSRYDESAINLYIWDQNTSRVLHKLPLAENIWNDQWIMVMDSWINRDSASSNFEIVQRKREARIKEGQRQEWDSLYRWVWQGKGFKRASTRGLAKRNFPLKDWASYEEPPPPTKITQLTITDEDFVWLPLETGDLTWENVILQIPKPYTIDKEPIANQININQIDTIYTITQGALHFKFYRTPDKHHIVEGRIGNEAMVFKNGLQVGISKSQFQNLFSKLSHQTVLPDQIFVRSRQGDRVFHCTFRNDTLTSIQLTNYLH